MNTDTKRHEQTLLRVALRNAIAQASDEQLEQDQFQQLAQRLANTKLDNSQFRNLENLAYTTDKISDITDLLKKLTGRDSRGRGWASENLGQQVIFALVDLRKKADDIVKNIPDHMRGAIDADLPRRVHLELCRELVKHLTAEFMYKKPKE